MKSETIMAHDFFAEIDWQQLIRKNLEAPFKPTVVDEQPSDPAPPFEPAISVAPLH